MSRSRNVYVCMSSGRQTVAGVEIRAGINVSKVVLSSLSCRSKAEFTLVVIVASIYAQGTVGAESHGGPCTTRLGKHTLSIEDNVVAIRILSC